MKSEDRSPKSKSSAKAEKRAAQEASQTGRGVLGVDSAFREAMAPVQAIVCVCKQVLQGGGKALAGCLNGRGCEV